MPPYSRPESDPEPSVASPAGSTPVEAEQAPLLTDFADLAARFSAPRGGGLPPDLAADLALEVVLNEIVMQACLATGATGAAIVLRRQEGMFCRASSGVTAPALGSVLDSSSGLLAECMGTGLTQRVDDTLTDTRADAAASLRLGVRSVMVMPLARGEELVGVFELFSSTAFAFGDRDERTLEALAGRTLTSRERAAQPPPVQVHPVDVPAAQGSGGGTADTAEKREEPTAPEAPIETAVEERTSRSALDLLTLVLAAAVIACAVLLGVLIGRHAGPQKAKSRPRPDASAAATQNPSSTGGTNAAVSSSLPAESSSKSPLPASPKPAASSTVPPGGLRVYQNGKEIFQLPPTPGELSAADQQIGVRNAVSVEPLGTPPTDVKLVELAPGDVESSLLYRVEPHYPDAARQQRVEGAVTLDVLINPDGSVETVHPVSGAPQLAPAATEAVRQWRFRPRTENGLPVRMHTSVTLNFQAPQ